MRINGLIRELVNFLVLNVNMCCFAVEDVWQTPYEQPEILQSGTCNDYPRLFNAEIKYIYNEKIKKGIDEN